MSVSGLPRGFLPHNDPDAIAVTMLSAISKRELPSGDARWLVALAGVPASGKTTLAKSLAAAINKHAAAQSDSKSSGSSVSVRPKHSAICVPMDGFHLTRAQLDAMPDPKLAHARRGAEWTFDAKGLSKALQALRTEKSNPPALPGFDHKEKDPCAGAYRVRAEHTIVIVEGLYLLLTGGDWATVSNQFHFRAFLFTHLNTCEKRIVPRHVRAGICEDEAAALARWRESDRANAVTVLEALDESKLDFKLVTLE